MLYILFSGLLARAGTSALLARSMVEMDGSKIRASRRAVTTPIAIVIPLSVAAVLARLDHQGISARVGPESPNAPRLTGMIRHCLIPRRIVGQLGYVQTKLLRDESGEIMGYCSPSCINCASVMPGCRRSASCSATPNWFRRSRRAPMISISEGSKV